MSYLGVCVVSFLLGGFVFPLVNLGSAKSADPQSAKIEKETGKPRSFAIEGMTCQGCADNITSALTAIPGVQSANVSLQYKTAVVVADGSQVANEKILGAIETAGYKGHFASAEPKTSATPASSDKQTVLVNITRGKNDLHAVSMAIGLAQSALKDGRKAMIFLNVEAPTFATKNLGDDVQFADFPPIKKMLVDFIASGGQLQICGHCAHVVKLERENTLEGAKILAHNELFATLPPNTVVFSY
jgi:copper chaperone CopZ/predicted peroxiredoxin